MLPELEATVEKSFCLDQFARSFVITLTIISAFIVQKNTMVFAPPETRLAPHQNGGDVSCLTPW
jgi:hypothetical protein